MTIFHIVLPEVWAAFDDDIYEHATLASEGFIHCSFDRQLDGVIERYYSGVDKVILLEIDSDKLTSEFVTEPSTGGEIYPHIYGPIDRDAIVGITERDLNAVKAERADLCGSERS